MRALQFSEYGPPEVLHVADVPQPHAGPGRIRIAVRASGLTPADGYLRSGRFRDWMPLPLPHTLGVDASGVVDEVGEGVTGVAPGDAVFGLVDLAEHGGASAEYAVLTVWAPKPAALSWEEAGGLAGNAETAARVLRRLDPDPGATLLIEGASGGAGSVVTQFAVARGVRVIGTASPRNHERLGSLGAIPTTYGPGLAERVRALAPQGIDVALDAAGSGSLPELVAITGDPDRVVSIADLHAARHGVHLSRSGGPGGEPPAHEGLATAAALADQGRLKRLVGAVFPLEQAARAHRLAESGQAVGKIILTP